MKRFAFAIVVALLAFAFGPHASGVVRLSEAVPSAHVVAKGLPARVSGGGALQP